MHSLAHSFTVGRIWNYARVLCSYWLTRLLGKTIHFGMPVSLAIEPTTSCNLRCPECPSGLRSFTRPTGNIDMINYQKYLDQLHDHIFYLTLYFQGEPYMHHDFFNMVEYANKYKIYTSTSTNAHYLNQDYAEKTVRSGLKQLIISLDGVDQEAYSSYRVGGEHEKVLEGISNLVYWKHKLKSKTPSLVLQFLVFKSNEHQINEIKILGKSLGVDKVRIKSAQVYNFMQGNPLLPEQPEYSRYEISTEGTYRIKSKLPNYCWRMWSSAVITWDGRIIPCCFDKDANHQLGDLNTDDFRKIWTSNNYRLFRKKVFSERNQIDICQNCTEGLRKGSGV